MDRSRQEHHQEFGLSADERMQRLAKWQADGAKIPPALVQSEGSRDLVVSSQFLYLGPFLFTQPGVDHTAFTDERRRFNTAAEKELRHLK